MSTTWEKMRKFRVFWWIHSEGAWMALLLFGVGCVGFGFSMATMYAQNARAQELQVNFAAFNSALAAKDQLINSIARSAVTATVQANVAVATAAQAAGVAADTATNAAKKSKDDAAQISKLERNRELVKPRGNNELER